MSDRESVNPFPDSSRGDLPQLGTLERAMPGIDMAHSLHRTLFNTEGEKQMGKIDWHKPLRARSPVTGRVQDQKVYTCKSGRQRVIWADERVYPVDDQGRAVASVDYGPNWVRKGQQIVENAPEEKFFVGLYRHCGTSDYFLEDGGVVKTRDQVELVEHPNQWIVDTRKSAEPPKAIAHDPEDYVTTFLDGDNVITSYLMTKRGAESYITEPGEQVVRVRTTPAPVGTARYIQLWRTHEGAPWLVNALGNGRQEFTWDETKNRGVGPCHTAVKVRD